MKKIFTKLMLWAVAATALVSCENKFDETTIGGAELTQTVTLSADKTGVRTELVDGVPYWSAEDQIGVYVSAVDTNGNPTYKNYTFKNDSEEATLTTTFTGTTAVANTLFVYYPYVAGSDVINNDGVVKANLPSTQQPTVNSFDGAADIMIAKPVTLDEEGNQLSGLEFARLGAIAKVVLKDNTGSLAEQHISTITMTTANDIAGKVYLNAINQELGALFSNKSQSVTANYTTATHFVVNGENAVYFVIYPTTLASGSTLSFTAATEEYTISWAKPLTEDWVFESGKVTTLTINLNAEHITKNETIEWVNNAYNLVPTTAALAVGDKVVIAAAGYDMAMGAQKDNNRGAVAITKNDNNTIDFDNSVEVLTVEAGTKEGTFAFKTSDNKYLYAASSSSNHLKAQETLSDNASFSVSIADGVATVIAQGDKTRNIIRYNSSNTLFSCYASGQQDICIYKLVGEYVAKAPAITLSVANVVINHDATSGEATVTATNGDGWAITATTDATWVLDLAYADGKITFTTTANDGEARTATVAVTATKEGYDDVTTSFTITQNKQEEVSGGTEVSIIYTFSNYTAGSQYAKNEVHQLDGVLTITTTQCHFTTELRIYSSSTYDGYAIGTLASGTIKSLGFNAGNEKDTLNVYGSTDGETWTLVSEVAITSTSYNDYSVDFGDTNYTYFKLDVAGTKQVRLATLTLTYIN